MECVSGGHAVVIGVLRIKLLDGGCIWDMLDLDEWAMWGLEFQLARDLGSAMIPVIQEKVGDTQSVIIRGHATLLKVYTF